MCHMYPFDERGFDLSGRSTSASDRLPFPERRHRLPFLSVETPVCHQKASVPALVVAQVHEDGFDAFIDYIERRMVQVWIADQVQAFQ